MCLLSVHIETSCVMGVLPCALWCMITSHLHISYYLLLTQSCIYINIKDSTLRTTVVQMLDHLILLKDVQLCICLFSLCW